MKSYCCLLFFSLLWTSSAYGYTREDVVLRDSVVCGVSANVPGFATVDNSGKWSGFDVDICRAVAAAVLGDANKTTFMPMEAKGAYTALLSGKVDLLLLHAVEGQWNFIRDSALAVDFTAVSFYDVPGVMVKPPVDGKPLHDLAGVPCITDTQKKSVTIFGHQIKTEGIVFASQAEALTAFSEGKCDMIPGINSLLRGVAVDGSAIVLRQEEELERVLFGPIVRQGDDNWFDIVRWTLFALLDAEALGFSSQNAEEMRTADNPQIKRFFGQKEGGGIIGLVDDWAAQIIIQVGNYGEIFSRNVGEKSRLKIKRDRNRLWRDGGLHCPPPLY